MHDFLGLLKEKKQILFIAIPFGLILLFIIFSIIILQSPSEKVDQPTPQTESVENPSTAPEEISIPPWETDGSSHVTNEVWPEDDWYGDYDPSGLQDVQSVEDLSDGTKKYVATSSDPDRPNILIAKENRTIYQRSIPLPGADIPVQNFIELFGQPDRIIEGPDFYGKNATNEYIYASRGISVVVDKSSGQVAEQHFFQPTTPDEYINKYGNDSYR